MVEAAIGIGAFKKASPWWSEAGLRGQSILGKGIKREQTWQV